MKAKNRAAQTPQSQAALDPMKGFNLSSYIPSWHDLTSSVGLDKLLDGIKIPGLGSLVNSAKSFVGLGGSASDYRPSTNQAAINEFQNKGLLGPDRPDPLGIMPKRP